MNTGDMPTREEAEALLRWAGTQNPGAWTDHSRVAARIAETIAERCGLDTERAYLSGLLHDIGRYEGVRGLHHVVAGYDLLRGKGWPLLAEICLSHSFPLPALGAYGGGDYDCTPEELSEIEAYLSSARYSEYDRLIQLCDSMALAEGVSPVEPRIVGVVRRYGFDDFTLRKWDAIFALKAYFDGLCGENLYHFFRDEITQVIFR